MGGNCNTCSSCEKEVTFDACNIKMSQKNAETLSKYG